jgi:autotransporter-associated beta strand protein
VVNSGAEATLTINGNVIYDAGNLSFLNGQATISANTTRSGNPFITVGDGAAADDLVISGKISGSILFLTKDGSGTLVLSGTNDYDPSAATNINAGTLLINGDSSAVTDPFNVNSTSTLGGNGTVGGNVTVTADANLSPGATGAVGTFSVLGALNISAQAGGTGKLIFALDTIAASDKVAVTGTLNLGTDVLNFSDFTFSTLAGLQNGTYKLITSSGLTGGITLDPTPGSLTGTLGAGPAQGTLQLNGGDLELVVSGLAPADPYLAWAGPGVNFEADANNDGVKNGLAWLLGAANPSASALGFLPTMVQSGGSLQMNFSMLNASSRGTATVDLQHSSDLGISDPWTSVVIPSTSGGPTSGVTFVITPGSPLNTVQATISSSEATGGKLFGRIKGIK